MRGSRNWLRRHGKEGVDGSSPSEGLDRIALGCWGCGRSAVLGRVAGRAKQKREERKQELDELEAGFGDQHTPRHGYEAERERILADQECGRQIVEAWAAYWVRRLAEHAAEREPRRTLEPSDE